MSGKCSICDVPFNSESQKAAHYEGTKHKKKEAARRLNSSSTEVGTDNAAGGSAILSAADKFYPRMCEVCPNVKLTSTTMAESHNKGDKHKKKLSQFGNDSLQSQGSLNTKSVASRDVSDGHARKSSDESDLDSDQNIDFCDICRCSFNRVDHAKAHYKGKDHVKKVKAKDEMEQAKEKGETIYFCATCSILCDTMEVLKIHNKSEGHMKMEEKTPEMLMAAASIKAVKAPKREHGQLVETSKPMSNGDLVTTRRSPREYQRELYEEMMKGNRICFLPTGMGKTLTSTLVVSHMMQANPTRQVVFVVDRKILVFQQADAMSRDLEEVRLPSSDSTSRHPVRIASVCGDKRSLAEGCRKLYEHDLIVITAGCYLNLLTNTKELRWDDVSCLILDEAHHCIKKHPYNQLVKEFYIDEAGAFNHHPKLVGLTASPAGDDTVKKTEQKLDRLMKNMSSKLTQVTRNEEEFSKFKPTAKICCVKAFYSDEEKQLAMVISRYSAACIAKANGDAKIASLAEINVEEIRDNGLDSESVRRLSQVVKISIEKFDPSPETRFYMNHLDDICGAWLLLNEAGISSCQEHLNSLEKDLQIAEERLLPVRELRECNKIPAGKAVGTGVDVVVKELLKLPWEEKLQKSEMMFALVLVQRREAASKLQRYLREHESLKEMGLNVARIVGHGKSGQDESGLGMTTGQQQSAMAEVREGKQQIIVATSVAEEGLDLPQCKLVIQMDVPRTVTSLVQIRGRARERGGKFVAICRDPDQEAKVQCLLRQEENMKEATKNIVQKQMLEQLTSM